jgi:hypothetical protein
MAAYGGFGNLYQLLWRSQQPLSISMKISAISINLYQVYWPYHVLHALAWYVIAFCVFPDVSEPIILIYANNLPDKYSPE